MRDPYVILGITPGADETEIKSAYRRLAKRYHPDLFPGDQKAMGKFREICEAYDQIRTARRDPQPATRKPRWTSFENERSEGNARAASHQTKNDHKNGKKPDEFLSDLFGLKGFQPSQKTRHHRQRSSRTVETVDDQVIRLNFEQAALGCHRRIRLSDGATVDVKIPAGLTDGQRIRLRSGRGDPKFESFDGTTAPDDVLFEVKVAEHPYFNRKGFNIHMELPVTIDEAVLGSKVEVPTIEGSVILKIPPGSNGDTIFRLRGKGARIFDPGNRSSQDQRGDQYINLKVILPDGSDKQFSKLVKKWATRNSYSVRQHLQSEAAARSD